MKIYSKYSSEVYQFKQRISFNSVCFFWAHVHLLDSLKLSLCCKRYSFIYPSVCAVNNLMFSILFALEFGARQLILPKRVSHFRCLPVANGCSKFHQILFVLLSFFWTKTTTKFFQNTIFVHIYDLFVIGFI